MPNVRPDTTKNTVLSQGEQKRGFYGAPNKGYWCPLVSVDPKKSQYRHRKNNNELSVSVRQP